MTLIRLLSRMDDKNKITIPRGIHKELNVKPRDTLELSLGGINRARRLFISKPKGRRVK